MGLCDDDNKFVTIAEGLLCFRLGVRDLIDRLDVNLDPHASLLVWSEG